MRNRLLGAAVACFAITSGYFVLAKPPASVEWSAPAPAAATIQGDESMSGMMSDNMGMSAGMAGHGAMPMPTGGLTKAQSDFFEGKVRPILIANCYKCHSDEQHKSKGGLHP